MAQQPLVDPCLLIVEDSWSHSDTPHSVGLTWTSDQPDAETSTLQPTTLTRVKTSMPWRDTNPQFSKRAAADPRLRPRGYWDRHYVILLEQHPRLLMNGRPT